MAVDEASAQLEGIIDKYAPDTAAQRLIIRSVSAKQRPRRPPA